MFSGNCFPRKGTSSYLKEIAFLIVRVGKRHHEIAIEEEESLGCTDDLRCFLRTIESRHWMREKVRKES